MRIDAHQHFWKYNPERDKWITSSMQKIARDFLPNDLASILNENNIVGCVAIQADQTEEETKFLLDLADQFSFVKAVVGWVDLLDPNLDDRLKYFSSFKKLKGFRHVVQSEPVGFLVNPTFIKSIKKLSSYNFTYDLLIYHHQLEEAYEFVRQVSEVKIIIDHLAKPSIKDQQVTPWAINITKLGAFPNVYCKISGMVTEADWTNWEIDDFTPYLDKVFECFGVRRIVYGSDWPVCILASTYKDQLSIIESYIAALSVDEKKLIMGENAKRFYNL